MSKRKNQTLIDRLPTTLLRLVINLWPPFLGAGIKVIRISADFRRVDVALKQKWFNRNYVGTHFGGSIFSMTDPFLMLMLLKNLSSNYIVWDKVAKIDYLKPGRGTLTAKFELTDNQIKHIRHMADKNGKYLFDTNVDVVDQQGEIIAKVVKTLYVRAKKSK